MTQAAITPGPVELRDLTVVYERHPAVHHLDGVFRPGSLTALVGPNGAGKSTLLKTIAGVQRPSAGSVGTGAVPRDRIGYLPQQAEIERGFPISVLDTVLLGHWRRIGWWGGVDAHQAAEARAALAAVGLAGFETRLIGSLSAGQLQRVLFARLMVQDAPVILLDEPFNALDAGTTGDLIALVRRWHGERRTIVAALHDLAQVRAHFPETLLLARECIGWGPTDQTLTPANLSRARLMSEAWDAGADWCERVAS